MKKALACALAASFVLTSAAPAFANTVTSTTKYIMDGTDTKLEVTSVVNGEKANEMVTFLAYRGASEAATIDDTAIRYIDQKNADSNGDATFTYTTSDLELSGIAIKSGAESLSEAAVDGDVYGLRSISVKYNDGDAVSVNLPTTYAEGVTTSIPTGLTVFVPGTVKSWDVLVNSTSVTESGGNVADYVAIADNGAVSVIDNEAYTDNAVITITSVALDDVTAPVVGTNAASGRYTGYDDGEPCEKMTVFSEVSVGSDPNFARGIVVYSQTAGDAEPSLETVKSGTKFPALWWDKETGKFAIQLVDKSNSDELIEKDWYALVYAEYKDAYGNDATTYSNSLIKIGVKAQAGYDFEN